ncbi:PLP-dependent aminotransferase family protein [Brachybacterium sacelli]
MRLEANALAVLLGQWHSGTGAAHRGLSEALQRLIVDGRLALGVKLPSERTLAEALHVSRTTTSTAYRNLVASGFLQTNSRTRAVVTLPATSLETLRPHRVEDVIDFSSASPAAPGELIHEAFRAATDYMPRHFAGNGYERAGIAELRRAIADRYSRRGLPTGPDQIMVTHGAQHALALVAHELLPRNGRVVIEHPTYPNAIRVFLDRSARITPISVADGWDAERFSAASRTADLTYLTPEFQNPTGLTMTEDVRRSMRLSSPTIVDETLLDVDAGPCSFSPMTPLAAYHPQMVTIGSLSKSVWGGLRVGWVRAGTNLIDRLVRSRSLFDLGNPVLEQLAAAELIAGDRIRDDGPRLARHRALNALGTALSTQLPGVTYAVPAGGVGLWVRLAEPISTRMANTAPDHGLLLAAGPRYGVGGAFERYLRLPFTLPGDELRDGVDRLAALYSAVLAGRTGHHPPCAIA